MTAQEKLGAKNIKDWYDIESQTRSYKSPNWKLSPERIALFKEFRDDPNYHIKNIVELIARSLILEMLRADGVEAKVFATSDSDDVFGGADVIAAIDTKHGEEYVAFDIAVSENKDYLDQKENPLETQCHEFNDFRKRKLYSKMPRVVFAIPPRVMTRFLSEYMTQIATKGFVEKKDILPLFKSSATSTVRDLSTKIHARIDNLIH